MFPNFKLKGCYFHYIKNIWAKAKKLGLCRKKFIDKTKLIIFALKIITFIKSENLNSFFTEITNFIASFNNEEKAVFNKFTNYYSKIWLKTNFIHFDLAYNENYTCRTNNLCESFHNTLTYSIEHPHPKLAIYIEEMIKIVKSYFNKSINNLVNIKTNTEYKDNTFNSIYNFIMKYHSKYHTIIYFKGLLQIENDLKYDLNKININILKILFGIRLDEDSNEDNDTNEISNMI
jgi:hypothetical protein